MHTSWFQILSYPSFWSIYRRTWVVLHTASDQKTAKYSINVTLMLLLIARTKFSDFSDQRHYR